MDQNKKIFLEEIRGKYLKISSEIGKFLEPRIFTLVRDHIENVRNFLIIIGALASFSVFLYGEESVNKPYLLVGVIGLLTALILGIVYLNRYTSKGVIGYLKKYKETAYPAHVMAQSITKLLKNEIKEEEFEEIFNDNTKNVEEFMQKNPNEISTNDYTFELLTILVIVSMSIIIYAISFPLWKVIF